MNQTNNKPLNTGQQAAADGFFQFLFSDQKEFILAGGGGVGKTYLMGHLIDEILPQYFNSCKLVGIEPEYDSVHMTATTNKAAEVLAEATNRPTSTIHSFLGLKVKEDFSTGRSILQKTANWRIHEREILFVDECLHPSMEIMTDTGFKRIDSLDKTELIAQFCQDTQEISYTTPIRYVKKAYVGSMVEVISDHVLNISVTANHDCLVNKNSNYQKIKAQDIKGAFKLPVAGKGAGVEGTLSLTEKFCIAYQADGSVIRPYTLDTRVVESTQARFGFTPLTGCGSTRFSFIKQRKITQFLTDFASLHITEHKDSSKGHKIFHVKNVPLASVSKKLRDVFNITNFSQRKAQEFIEYVSLWDGWKQGVNGIGYGSTNYDNACFVQEVAILAGYRAVLTKTVDNRSATFNDYYKVSIKTSSSFVNGQVWNKNKQITPYSGDVYCVTVPKGNIIVRREGKVCITGNCSMIDFELLKIIRESTLNCKIIYVGDDCQLPPVFEELSHIYKSNLPYYELTEPMRTDVPEIQALCAQARNTVKTGIFKPIQVVPGIIDWLDTEEVMQLIEDTFVNQKSNSRVLAYSNNRVNSLNSYIRELRGLPETFQTGDELISNSALQLSGGGISVEEPVTIIRADAEISTLPKHHNLQIQYMDLKTPFKVFTDVPVPVDKSHFDQLTKYYAKQKDWISYFDLKNKHPDLRPRDACTTHKSQGSSYDVVFIDLDNLSTCTQANLAARLLYVALTRARKRIVMYGQLAAKYGGLIE
jgi:hypothetical protein